MRHWREGNLPSQQAVRTEAENLHPEWRESSTDTHIVSTLVVVVCVRTTHSVIIPLVEPLLLECTVRELALGHQHVQLFHAHTLCGEEQSWSTANVKRME